MNREKVPPSSPPFETYCSPIICHSNEAERTSSPEAFLRPPETRSLIGEINFSAEGVKLLFEGGLLFFFTFKRGRLLVEMHLLDWQVYSAG